MKTLYILSGFNNYYNRMVKLPGDTTEDYPTPFYTLDATNFVPNDGVNTEHVVGTYDYSGEGDYLLVVDSPNQVIQRWFIIDSVRNKAGQYTLTLRRDLIADYYNVIKQSPMFIEKATLQNKSTLMYNQESISVNQIKLKQDALKDFSGIPWLVGYLPKKYKNDNWVNLEYSADRVVDIELKDGIANWEYYKYNTGVNFSIPQRIFFGTAVNTDSASTTTTAMNPITKRPFPIIKESNGTYWNYQAFEGQIAYTDYKDYSLSMTSSGYQIPNFTLNGNYGPKVAYSTSVLEKLTNNFYSKVVASRVPTKQEISDFNDLKGKIVHDAITGLYYQVELVKRRTALYIDYPPVDNQSPSDTTFALMRDNFKPNAGIYYNVTGSPNKFSFPVYWTAEDYYIDLVDVSGSAKFKVDDTDRYETADSAFDIFAIPYTDNLTLYSSRDGQDTMPKPITSTSESLALAVALQTTAQLGQGSIYDLQLLPYCPCRYIEKFYKQTPGWHQREDGTWSGTGDFYDIRTEYCLDITLLQPVMTGIYKIVENPTTNDLLQVMLWATESSFTFDIPYTIDIPTDIKELKVANQCDNYRLVSPTGSGQFEFSAVMNGGVQYFNIDCTYQPFNPYIHINPNFGELYGQDYNDWRGLICSGDFSLPQQTSAWANYKLQNKNYQESFDRTLQNMRVQHDAQRTREAWGVATGTLSGAISGATTGAIASGGNPYAAIAGGLVGGTASLLGGFADQQMNEKLRAEAINYAKDQFGYQLDNIKALPYGVTKSTPLTNNNPIFPILEYYSCTETEKQIVRDKLRWNGMTIMAIGTIESYYNPDEEQYIKGQLIRFEDFGEDFHIVNSIAGELNKGVFI